MTSKQQAELERIRHYVGTLDDFKSFWDQQAGSNTNAYSTPDRQGYGGVHPTRDEVSSPHWREKKTEAMKEAVDKELGHTDDEAGMMANDLSVIARYAKDLEEMMKEFEASGQEIDFPHWWQSKIVLAKEYMVKAKHYIRAEMEKKPATGLPTFETFVAEGFEGKDFRPNQLYGMTMDSHKQLEKELTKLFRPGTIDKLNNIQILDIVKDINRITRIVNDLRK